MRASIDGVRKCLQPFKPVIRVTRRITIAPLYLLGYIVGSFRGAWDRGFQRGRQ